MGTKKKGNILYVSYDGMTDPLGQSQVLAYLENLSERGFNIHLLSYEKPSAFLEHKSLVEARVLAAKINWHPLSYTKSPPVFSTVFDLFRGWCLMKRINNQLKFDIVHCRGYIAAILGRKMKSHFGTKFIFDMRGWWADEKLESGLWNSGIYKLVYRYFKYLEEEFFKESDVSISLTYAGKSEIEKRGLKSSRQVEVIPTCVNFNYFGPYKPEYRQEIRSKLCIPTTANVLVYSGSLGGNYNPDILFQTFKLLEISNANWHLLILSKCSKSIIEREQKKFGIAQEKVFLTSCNYIEVSKYLMAADVGFIFYNKSYSTIGRSPTKMAEYWSAGLPILSISGIGDLDYLLKKYPQGGYLLNEVNQENCNKAQDELMRLKVKKDQLYEFARDYFDLAKGADSYYKLYQKVLADGIAINNKFSNLE